MSPARDQVLALLSDYRPASGERADVERVIALAESTDNPWLRTSPLHFTASALIVHPASGRVLLRWHQRQRAWLQVGGHADPSESDALAIALREAREETGLTDLVAWPDERLRQVTVVPVPASTAEPAHEHADLRFLLATRDPAAATAESPDAPLRWVSPAEALTLTTEDNLRDFLALVQRVMASHAPIA
jgi:8-oxo-dGTP pyrophosphatase MutT (NUDIX family)